MSRTGTTDTGSRSTVVKNTKAIVGSMKVVGLQEVGVMRQYERTAHGRWCGCSLMAMLKHELR
jgi:hypothetical protein